MAWVGNDEYVTLTDAARLLGISVLTLNRWARQGRIPSEISEHGSRILLRADLARIAVEGDDPPPVS